MASFVPILPVPLQDISLHYPSVQQLAVLRIDKLDAVVSGNKWFKLRYYLSEARKHGFKKIVTWGGAWSNHIVATAAICAAEGFESVGLIRGEEPTQWSNTLQQAAGYGMKFVFLPRSDFDEGFRPDEYRTAEWFPIPVGGYGPLGAAGAKSILEQTDVSFDHIVCAVGTGTMMAGLINGCSQQQQLTGISALKGHLELEENIQNLLTQPHTNWAISRAFHFGGYARYRTELIDYMNEFYKKTKIPTDFVYTGKLFFGLETLLKQGYFAPESRILAIHSGGLQGNRSLEAGRLAY